MYLGTKLTQSTLEGAHGMEVPYLVHMDWAHWDYCRISRL